MPGGSSGLAPVPVSRAPTGARRAPPAPRALHFRPARGRGRPAWRKDGSWERGLLSGEGVGAAEEGPALSGSSFSGAPLQSRRQRLQSGPPFSCSGGFCDPRTDGLVSADREGWPATRPQPQGWMYVGDRPKRRRRDVLLLAPRGLILNLAGLAAAVCPSGRLGLQSQREKRFSLARPPIPIPNGPSSPLVLQGGDGAECGERSGGGEVRQARLLRVPGLPGALRGEGGCVRLTFHTGRPVPRLPLPPRARRCAN